MCQHPEELVYMLRGFFQITQMPSFRQVLCDLGESNQAAPGVIQSGYHNPRPEKLTIFPDAPAFILCAAGSARESEFLPWLSRLQILCNIKAGEVLAEDFFATVAFDAFRTRVPAGDHALGIDQEYRIVRYAFDEQPEPLFALAQCFFLFLSLAEVPCDLGKSEQLAIFIA